MEFSSPLVWRLRLPKDSTIERALRDRTTLLRSCNIKKINPSPPEDLVQLLDHVLLLVGVVDVEVEHLAECLRVFEHRRQQEVQQRPQLVQVVLTINHVHSKEGASGAINGMREER